MINSIQFLRGIAALMVLFFHAQSMVYEKIGYHGAFTNTGAAGVDIFFVISGFVIYLVFVKNLRSPGVFLAKRIIRVGPPYWLYTTITVAILLFMPSAFKTQTFDLGVVASSYFFLLSENPIGGIGTVLGVGWTIAFEMYFYLLFFVATLVAPKKPMAFFASFIAVGVVASMFIQEQAVPAFTLVALSALPLEFMGGCLIAMAYLKGIRVPRFMAFVFIVLGLAVIYYGGLAEKIDHDRDPWRVLFWGVPALLIVGSFVSLDSQKPIRFPKSMLILGGASYSLYLCHQFVLAAIGKSANALHLKQVISAEVLVIFGMALAVGVALLSYRFVERPVTDFLNRALDGGRSRKAVVPV